MRGPPNICAPPYKRDAQANDSVAVTCRHAEKNSGILAQIVRNYRPLLGSFCNGYMGAQLHAAASHSGPRTMDDGQFLITIIRRLALLEVLEPTAPEGPRSPTKYFRCNHLRQIKSHDNFFVEAP